MAAQELFFHFEKGKIFSQKTKSYTLTWVNELATVIPCAKLAALPTSSTALNMVPSEGPGDPSLRQWPLVPIPSTKAVKETSTTQWLKGPVLSLFKYEVCSVDH